LMAGVLGEATLKGHPDSAPAAPCCSRVYEQARMAVS
jgi:hypothetical protein